MLEEQLEYSDLEREAALVFHSALSRGPCIWAELEALIGAEATKLLLLHYGGATVEEERAKAVALTTKADALEAELAEAAKPVEEIVKEV